ncbi:MAG: stage II sporulation protein P [Syntrophomonadaceae bacterium]
MRRRNFLAFLKGILFIQIFLVVIIAGLSMDINRKYVEGVQLLSRERILWPFSGVQITERQAEFLLQENNVLLAGIDNIPGRALDDGYSASTTPENMLGAHIQALAFAGHSRNNGIADPEEDLSGPGEETAEMEETVVPNAAALARLQKSQVFLYCTHGGETYLPNSGTARLDGKRGLINQVASTLEKSLQDSGLPTQFIDTIHDADYNKSYTLSRQTVTKIVNTNKNIIGLFDIHRDSIPGESKASTVSIDGKKCARILIVVGTDERKPHPRWKQNYAFAEKIYREGEKMYPGLIKGVITKAGTYNQEYHPRALVLEFGSDTNNLDEVTRSARLFAEILVEVLKEVE